MLFVKEDIPSKLFSEENFPTEPLFVEMNKRRKKCVLNSSYNPNRENKENHFESFHLIIVGDFNVCWKKYLCQVFWYNWSQKSNKRRNLVQKPRKPKKH